MTPPDEAQRLIEEHIASLDEKKAQLERALGHLRGPGTGKGNVSPGRRPQARNRPQSEPAGGNRSQAPRGARRKEVIADLEANPGSKAADVASRVGIAPAHANTILSNLTKQGRATKDGAAYTLVAE
jgi:type II secretory pathway pseudopilin PulG